MTFDIILQNNASKEVFVFKGLDNKSNTDLYLRFIDINLSVPDGEYTYFVVFDQRTDVEYETNPVAYKTILHTSEGDVVLKDLKPLTGLLRVGMVNSPKNETIAPKTKNNDTIYYKR